MNNVWFRTGVLAGVLALFLTAGLAAQQAALPAPPSPAAAPAAVPDTPAVQRLKAGNFAEALKLADEALAKDPKDLDSQVVKVEALMGLRRYADAGNLAWGLANQHPDRPDLRMKAGISAYRCGAYPASLKAWTILSQTPQWNGTGFHLGIQCQQSLGKQREAHDLLKEALARLSPPTEELVDDMLLLETDPQVCLPALDAFLKTNPKDRAYYESQRAIYAASATGRLFQGDAPPAGPIKIPLEEKSDQKDVAVVSNDLDTQISSYDTYSTTANVVLPVSVNDGEKHWMLLDSGSSFMMLGEDAIKELKLQPIAAGEYQGFGGGASAKTSWVLLQKVQVGPLTFHNVPALLVAKKSDFWAKRGIMPISMFRDWAVHYDRRHSHLDLYPSGTDPEQIMGKGTFKVPSVWFRGMPYVAARIQGTPGLFCSLDTGAAVSSLASEHTAELGVKANTGKYETQRDLGVTGSVSAAVAEKVQVVLGTATFNLNTVQVLPQRSDLTLLPVYGNVGREILDLFDMVFDYGQNTVAFKDYK